MRRIRAGAVVWVALVCAVAGAAQDKGNWFAASTEAKAITGDIAISNAKVSIDYLTFSLAWIRRLKPVEVSSAFDADVNAGISGDLYRLKVPPGQRFQHKNTLCGTEETQWMATYVTGRTLQVAFFSGDDMPVFTFGAMTNATNRCGTFSYSR
jgi:hypothetical protein